MQVFTKDLIKSPDNLEKKHMWSNCHQQAI